MNLDKILTLLEAGFTKDEIMSMEKENGQEKAQKEPETEKEEAKKEEQPTGKEEAKKDEGSSIQEDYVKSMKEMTEEIRKIASDLKKSNLAGYDSQILDPVSQGQKVLAKIIDPPVKAKKGKNNE